MSERHGTPSGNTKAPQVPHGLLAFCFALMGPAFAINSAFIALAIPAMAPYGVQGLVVVGLIGSVFGIFPALWLARRIHEGVRED